MIQVPIPATFEELLWLIIGFMFGLAWSVKDQEIKQRPSFEKLSWIMQKLISFLLDFTHHFWIGGLIGLYAPWPQIQFFGWGLFYHDWKDIPRRFRKLISGFRNLKG